MQSDTDQKTVPTEKIHALVLLIKEMMNQIDEIAALKRKGYKAELSVGLLKETASVLKDLPPELFSAYLELLPTVTQSSKIIEPKVSETYANSVANAKRRFIQRVRKDLLSNAA